MTPDDFVVASPLRPFLKGSDLIRQSIIEALSLDNNQTTVLEKTQKSYWNTMVEAPAGTGKSLLALALAFSMLKETPDEYGEQTPVLIVTSSPHASEAFRELCDRHGFARPFTPLMDNENDPKIVGTTSHDTYNSLYVRYSRFMKAQWQHAHAVNADHKINSKRHFGETVMHLMEFSIPDLRAIIEGGPLEVMSRSQAKSLFGASYKKKEEEDVIKGYVRGAIYEKLIRLAVLDRVQFTSETAATMEKERAELLKAVRKTWAVGIRCNDEAVKRYETLLKERNAGSYSNWEKIEDSTHDFRPQEICPVWLIDKYQVENLVPMRKNMFKKVIIDEGHAVSAFEAAPIMHRAEYTILIGDRKQIPPETSHLPVKPDSRYHQSIMEFYESTRLFRLNNHYRCLPQLIEFSSERYYGGKLKVTTHRPSNARHGEILDIKSRQHMKDEVVRFIKDHDEHTVGVFVADNAEFVTELTAHIYANVDVPTSMNLKVDVVDTFSGAERDHVLFCVLDTDDISSGFFDCPRRVNTMSTRGKYGMTLFTEQHHSVLTGKETEFSHLVKHIALLGYSKFKPSEPTDPWQRKVGEVLQDAGYDVYYNVLIGNDCASIVIGDIDNSVALNTAPNGVKTGIGWTTFDVYESMYGGHIMHMVEFITEMKQRLEKEGQAGNYGKRQ